MEALAGLSIIVLSLALLLLIRARRRAVVTAAPGEESMFVTAPERAMDETRRRQSPGAPPGRILLLDRLQGGIVAALLIGAVVAVLVISGLAGPLGSILAKPASALFGDDRLGSVLPGVATMALVAFAIGFARPRLMHRLR